MSRDAKRVLGAIAVLVAANAGAYGLRASLNARESAAPSFPDLPSVAGKWRGEEMPVDDDIYAYLAPDKLSSKAYRCGEDVILAGAVYSRDWRSVHSPAACFSSTGWSLAEQRHRVMRVSAGVGELPVEELLGVQGKKQRAALYTFLTPGEATHSWMLQCWRMAVSGRGRGGVLLLLTADVRESPARTQELMGELLAELYGTFAETWQAGKDR